MKTTILGLLAETAIHPGAGQDTGFVDLPVAREAATDYPVIVGSSFKGALLDRARAKRVDKAICNKVFGEQQSAGALLVSDARLVLLPVRCLTSHYKWVTCPHLLERLGRHIRRGRCSDSQIPARGPAKGAYLGAGNGPLFLEERQFEHGGDLPEGLIDGIKRLVAHAETQDRLADQVVVLHNDDFAWFARFGLAVTARNMLDEVKKTSKNLWYEETLPPDSLFYCLLAERNGFDAIDTVKGLFDKQPYVQVGGNETVGQGWMAITLLEGGAQ